MTRFESEVNDHILHGAIFLVFNIKCRTKERYMYTINSFKVEKKREYTDIVVEDGKDYLTNLEFLSKCLSQINSKISDISDSLKNDGVLFLNEEMRFLNKDIIQDIWIDICCE